MFKDIIGQDSAIKILRAAVGNKRCASSYLFVGQEGVGKKLVALSFAQAINCQRQSDANKSIAIDNFDACGECLSCRKIIQEKYPDVEIISPQKTSISINQIRLVQKSSFLKPMQAKQKIYIINNAETLTEEAMNCFLKTLEEPSAKVIFILITSNLLYLFPTIISRCQIIKFNMLNKENISKILMQKYGVGEDEAYLLASISGGSIGKAFNYLNYGVVNNRKNMVELLNEIESNNLSVLLQEAETLSKTEDDIQTLLNLFLSLYRDILITRIFLDSEDEKTGNKLLVNTDFWSDIKDKAKSSSILNVQDKIEIILNTKELIEKNVNSRLALETMFLKLIETGSRDELQKHEIHNLDFFSQR